MVTINKQATSKPPRCVIIGGPNGAGKTTFARQFLVKSAGIDYFINADLIASGLAPLKPTLAAVAAARLMLAEMDRLSRAKVDFAFESTLSGLAYAPRLRTWKAMGYRIEIVFLKLESPRLALRRIAERVKEGGHDIRRPDVLRRFTRSWLNFTTIYRPLADEWWVYDNSASPILMEHGP
jgi:predicted ABC-type ATPase